MKYEAFNTIYEFYKKHYDEIANNELYKWKAVKNFQENWDIEAEDFLNMLTKSLKRVYNLMDSGSYYPKRMILWAAERDPEIVREMFKNLYDLDIDLDIRVSHFKNTIKAILAKYPDEKRENSYQDDRAIMVYLSMRYPEKYYMYKYNLLKRINSYIDYLDMPTAGTLDCVFAFESICEMILKRVLEDEELLKKYESRKAEYYDPEYHLLVQDIIFSTVYFDNPQFLHEQPKEIKVKTFDKKALAQKGILTGSHVDFINQSINKKNIGESGEEFVFHYEREKVKGYKLPKKKQVRWVSKMDGDGLGYDILSYDEKGDEIYIEVKSTKGKETESFFITANELQKSEECPSQYRLYRVFNLDTKNHTGDISIKEGSLKDLCIVPSIYKVDLK